MDRRKTHQETARGFDSIAASKYRDEFRERVELLRTGCHSLLDVEVDELGDRG